LEKDRLAQLYLFTSLIVLSLLVRLFVPKASLFIDAVYATISTPVVYTMTYYTRQMREVGEFVRRKKVPLARQITYELAALTASYMVGFFMFYALTGSTNHFVYSIAYVASQTMRVMNLALIEGFERLGADSEHPFLVMCGAIVTAFIHFLVIYPLFLVGVSWS